MPYEIDYLALGPEIIIVGTIISIVALAIATKIAALILGVFGFVAALLVLLLKLAILIAVVAFVIWLFKKVTGTENRSETV